jgi:hypothetical protein
VAKSGLWSIVVKGDKHSLGFNLWIPTFNHHLLGRLFISTELPFPLGAKFLSMYMNDHISTLSSISLIDLAVLMVVPHCLLKKNLKLGTNGSCL